ncbi:MAG: bifunctional DNA-formamidopyrimidine glycosylase/DNA-(apurinic or apyrimidinic site) lyase [Gemmatimonadota bacterium]
MPELPEVELAIRRLRPFVEGRVLRAVARLHPSTRRALPPAHVRAAVGQRVLAVARRGKYQVFELARGDRLVAHFRLDGDWNVGPADAPLPRYARLALTLDDGRRVSLVDPRAFATVTWHRAGEDPIAGLGPEPFDPGFTPARFRAALARRRAAIKLVLLDQRVLAGVGNIYAAEALWHAGVHPDIPADRIGPSRAARLLDAVRLALSRGLDEPGRVFATAQTTATTHELMVYGRDGEPCRRCGRRIRRVVHGARGTWYCAGCQR